VWQANFTGTPRSVYESIFISSLLITCYNSTDDGDGDNDDDDKALGVANRFLFCYNFSIPVHLRHFL
jgi:hypothetical protein